MPRGLVIAQRQRVGQGRQQAIQHKGGESGNYGNKRNQRDIAAKLDKAACVQDEKIIEPRA
jgi:hypothetical protein